MMLRQRIIRTVGLVVLLVSTLQVLLAGQATAQTVACADYSSTSAAQFALDINPALASGLDPDGNGIACDDQQSGQSGTSGADRGTTDLQLPGTGDPSPTPAGQQGQPNVDAVDQQPTGDQALPSGQQGQQAQSLDGRLGGTRAGWEAVYGAPTAEEPGSRPEIVLTSSTALATSSSFVTLWFNDQAFLVFIDAETSWSGAEAAPIIQQLMPTDITSIPDGEELSDGSLLIPMFSAQLAQVVSADVMADAGAPGVPGDLYLLLTTDGGDRAVQVEIGIGNGDNVREDVNSGDTTTTSAPTQAPDTTTTTSTTVGTNAFLQGARAEVNRLLGEYDEFMAILAAGTFTDAEIDRMDAILSGWIALEDTLPAAPPEHAALATQLSQVRTDLGFAALLIISGLDANDTATIDEAISLMDSAHAGLLDLDQQLTALGI